jgi:hypothetical protein
MAKFLFVQVRAPKQKVSNYKIKRGGNWPYVTLSITKRDVCCLTLELKVQVTDLSTGV